MLNKLIFLGLAYYFYTDMKKKMDAAIADRDAMLNFLTPEQKAALLQGISMAKTTATEVVKTVTQ